MLSMCRKQFAIVALALLVALIGGCALGGKQPDLPPEEAVKIRAQAWADALLARDFDTAYGFTTPNYREYSSAQRYSSTVAGSLRWTAIEVDSVQCGEDVCEARVIIDYKIKRYGIESRRAVDYKWLNVAGQWWLYVSPR
jgi:hypothetical protein